MRDRLLIWLGSRPLFWRARTSFRKAAFVFERESFTRSSSFNKAKTSIRILGSFARIGLKSAFWVVLCLIVLTYLENFAVHTNWLKALDTSGKSFVIEQLRLYAQLLTAIFSIYFATIGIILSGGYTRLRKDIIQMLTNEQIGSVYSRCLVLAAIFSLAATALPILDIDPGRLIYWAATSLTILSALALFPLGQRLFNFFDIVQLVHSEILPNIAQHIDGIANKSNSDSLAHHRSKLARKAFEQFAYIDDRVKDTRERLDENLPELTTRYTSLILHYLQNKQKIDPESYWFPRRRRHKDWFFAGDTATTMALETSSQQMLFEDKADHRWLENEIIDRLAEHLRLALKEGDLNLALRLLLLSELRMSAYAKEFQFELGMQELEKFRVIIENELNNSKIQPDDKDTVKWVAICDAWAAMCSNLCLETLRRMITFADELQHFFAKDTWDQSTLRTLPAVLQIELSFLIDFVEFEIEMEGRRLSQPKYLKQIAVLKLLKHYSTIIPQISDYFHKTMPSFVEKLVEMKITVAATQVALTSLHSLWKIPRWFSEISNLWATYLTFEHYKDERYKLPTLDFEIISKNIEAKRHDTLAKLGHPKVVKHIFDERTNDELPDHFGQIYFELGEACIKTLERNDAENFARVFPMFCTLAIFSSDNKFADPKLEIDQEYRFHLISTVISDLTSILGYAILYAEYFENAELSEVALSEFDKWLSQASDQQEYLERMLLFSDSFNFSMSASPRSLIRTGWKISFESCTRKDGYGDQMRMTRGKQHPNIIVREFLHSHAEPSHLFFALHVLPKLSASETEMNRNITELSNRINSHSEGTTDEGS